VINLQRPIRWELSSYSASHSVLDLYGADPQTREALVAVRLVSVRRLEVDSSFTAVGVDWAPSDDSMHRVTFRSADAQTIYALAGFAIENTAGLDHSKFMNGLQSAANDIPWERLFGAPT